MEKNSGHYKKQCRPLVITFGEGGGVENYRNLANEHPTGFKKRNPDSSRKFPSFSTTTEEPPEN